MADLDSMSMRDIIARTVVDTGNNVFSQRIQGSISIGGTRTKLQATQNLATSPFIYVTNINSDFYFRGVTISITNGSGVPVDITEDISLIIDEGDNNFDVPLIEENTLDENGNPTNSFAFFPDSNVTIFGSSGTQFKVRVTNANLTGVVNMTLYLEVV